jgi:Uma2 family endonuclease
MLPSSKLKNLARRGLGGLADSAEPDAAVALGIMRTLRKPAIRRAGTRLAPGHARMSTPLRTQTRLMTAEEFAGLPDDGKRYELVRGVLVEVSHPQSHHGIVLTELAYLLKAWLREHPGGGHVLADAGHVVERGPDTVRGPDVAYVRAGRLDLRKTSWVEGGPDLAVEIRSPGDRKGEIEERVADYLRAGTSLVWIVDPAKQTVVVRAPGVEGRTLTVADTLEGGEVLPGFSVVVREVFADLGT